MTSPQRANRIGRICAIACLLLVLTGCHAVPSASDSAPSGQTAPAVSASSTEPVQTGVSETFRHHGLAVTVSNVEEIRQESVFDGMETWEYDVYVVGPGAVVTILEAGMSDPSVAEDGQAHPQWGFLFSQDERVKILDGMEPIELTSDLTGIYNLEASIYVLGFEMKA